MKKSPEKMIHSSLERLVSMLGEIRSAPHLFVGDSEIATALKSQGNLSKYSNAKRGIISTSLNTQRKHADHVIEDGYRALDNARKAAADAIFRHRASEALPASSTKAGLLARAKALEIEVGRLEGDLEVLSDLLERSMRQARGYADAAGQLSKDRCRKEQAEILALLGPRSKPRMKVVA